MVGFASAFSHQRFYFYFVDGFFTVSVCVVGWSLPPVFSSGVLWFLGLMFQSLLYFELLFVGVERQCSPASFSCVAVRYPQHRVLKGLCFLPTSALASFVVLIDQKYGFISGLSSCSTDLCFCFRPVPYCLITISLQYSLKSGT